MEHEEERNLTQSKHTQESLELQNQLQDSETTRQALQQEVTELRERIDSIRQVRHRTSKCRHHSCYSFNAAQIVSMTTMFCLMHYKGAILSP